MCYGLIHINIQRVKLNGRWPKWAKLKREVSKKHVKQKYMTKQKKRIALLEIPFYKGDGALEGKEIFPVWLDNKIMY